MRVLCAFRFEHKNMFLWQKDETLYKGLKVKVDNFKTVSMLINIIFDAIPDINVAVCLVAGVMMAARSLIQLFRVVNPALLHKKDRASKLLLL